jgi:hypothetical protein
MISVFVQNKFLAEKKYILDYILGEVLKLDYEIKTDNFPTYRFISDNHRLEINDAFFSKLDPDYSYYKDSSLIPKNIDYLTCEGFDYAFPVLFGNDNLQNEDGFISCGNDIIAASFFMLSRWEEIAINKRDTHDRFCEEESLAVKQGFYNRPIVNEYIELFVKMMNDAGIIIQQPDRVYRVFLTHDVDDIARYDKISKIFKAFGGDIVKRKSAKLFFKSFKDVCRIKLRKHADVYNRFDFIMNISEKKGLKSAFYFIPGWYGEEDVRFNIHEIAARKIIGTIKHRGHIVGIHPSYSSYCNPEQLLKEKKRMLQYNPDISEGRQHYLRYKVPQTWRDWESCGLKTDTGMGFYDRVGFKCGICYEFPLFDIENKTILQLRERPLIVMDTALRKAAVTKEKCIEDCIKMAEITRKYYGDFVLLWHNSNLSVNEWAGWDKVYEQITEKI